MARQNLISNPSFRAGTAGYTPSHGASIVVVSGYAFYGTESLKIVKDDQNSSGIQLDPISVVEGLPYAFSAYVRVPVTVPATEDANLTMKVTWLADDASVISDSSSAIDIVTPEDGAWTRLTGVDIAPAGAVQAVITVVQLTAGSASEVFYLDALLFEQSTYVGGYLDNISTGEETSVVNRGLTPYPAPTVGTLPLNADVSLGDLVFNTIDENNVVWVCTDIVGWWGEAEPVIADIPRGVEDGSYDVSGRYQARSLTLNGTFLLPNPSLLGAVRDQLVSAINLVRRGVWLKTNEDPTRAAFVRLTGQPQIATVNARGRTDFSVGLKAADPIKYHWNDEDPEGLTIVEIDFDPGSVDPTVIGTVTNIGTSDVTAVFEITGPIGANSVITNITNNQTITTTDALRGVGGAATINTRQLTDNMATLTTDNAHGLVVGDNIIVSGVGTPFDSVGAPWAVTAVTSLYPFTVSYAVVSADVDTRPSLGVVNLAQNDVLDIDTYGRSVEFNDVQLGNRSRVETLIDWIKLAPGDNIISFTDNEPRLPVVLKELDSDVALLTTTEAHYLLPGEVVTVELPETVTLAKKALEDGAATITTSTPHGFSIGDLVDVASTEVSTVASKEIVSNVATLTTTELGAFNVGDSITVQLPTAKTVAVKSATSNVVTLGTSTSHGYSIGDAITVNLPTTTTPTSKSLTSNIATIGTAGAHNFSIGDSITVALPTAANITNKYISGSTVIMTTSGDHHFAVGDSVVVALPTTATLTDSRAISGAPGYLVTLHTSSAHNFSVGDKIQVNVGLTATATVSNRSATTSACTLTTSAAHKFSIGENITVSGVSTRYDGSYVISGTTGTTVTYASTGAAESSTSSTGTVLDTTISVGYNGTKIIETVPTTTTFTYLSYAQDVATSSTVAGSGATLSDTTNTQLNGTVVVTLVTTSSPYQFSYTAGA